MHEIAFQADKRFAEMVSQRRLLFPSFLFHEGILFVITFTRRIYSTSSHVFLAGQLGIGGRWGGRAQLKYSLLQPVPLLDYCLFFFFSFFFRLDYVELATI